MPSSLAVTLIAAAAIAAAVNESTAALLLAGLAVGIELALFIASGFVSDDGLGT